MAQGQDDGAAGPAWHPALIFAITGERTAAGTSQLRPDLAAVGDQLAARTGGLEQLRADVRARRAAGRPWPYPIPDDLRRGLGAAQLLAALAELRRRLLLDEPERAVLSNRAPDADERRLLADVPPHHGH
ncbi:hypothetical protein [Microlunatus soli]|uniref:Uncharacterized protein n=1 Tax=Microlunatus soli TaxID=630515 RepID=A0A1H1RBS3_9ACTN|nr:hypothetical protein [Microlunatus soli]SDS33172.1 hypothetical protein SAMN04489812_1589 [Microlunatus soli]